MYFLIALFSNKPEVFLPEYSQPVILHAAHLRRVVKCFFLIVALHNLQSLYFLCDLLFGERGRIWQILAKLIYHKMYGYFRAFLSHVTRLSLISTYPLIAIPFVTQMILDES